MVMSLKEMEALDSALTLQNYHNPAFSKESLKSMALRRIYGEATQIPHDRLIHEYKLIKLKKSKCSRALRDKIESYTEYLLNDGQITQELIDKVKVDESCLK